MTRRLAVPNSLSRKRIRPSFDKWNVYNALTWRKNRSLATQYRQVFFAKQESRSYHGDRLTENQFKNHFRGELPVVSPLQVTAGRQNTEENIPYALQTFVGLERRLDFAVFRALFASSVRQAAVFILRGSVKVNGVRIRSPGYIMRPGDMFSVDPRRVLYALGRPKPSAAESIKLTNRIISRFNRYLDRCRKNPERMWAQRNQHRKRHAAFNTRFEARQQKRVEAHNSRVQQEMQRALDEMNPRRVLEQVLLGQFKVEPKAMKAAEAKIATVKGLTASEAAADAAAVAGKYYPDKSEDAEPGANRRDVRRHIADLVKTGQDSVREAYQAQFAKGAEPYDPKWVERLPAKMELVPEDADPQSLRVNLPFSPSGRLYGLAEPKKTWFTPWTPRQFLTPFAILPHHIEISFEACHAVYLRDPVARPNHSEVISPFNLDMHERAYLWYVYRRRKNLPKVEEL